MKPAPFSLHLPSTLPEALELLASSANPRLIAGGQSLMPMLNMRLVYPDDLIDLNGIAELSGIRMEKGEVVIGAMTRQRDIEFAPLVAEHLPLLKEAIVQVGHRQTRNRGTIGGSVCHLDPAAEQPTVAIAMDAMLTLQRAGSMRSVPMRDFAVGLMSSCLESGEMLTALRFKPWPAHCGHGFVEYGRRHGDFAIASAAAMVELGADGRVVRSSLTLGGVGPVPFRMLESEAVLAGSMPETAAITCACAVASRQEALDDPSYPAWYRQRIAPRLLEQALRLALTRARISPEEVTA